jgi:hypothetical protein
MRSLALILIFSLLTISLAEAHRSGCHRWHSCPSDSGSYICGDTGRCSACPDNQYCQAGKPITRQSKPNESYESSSSFIKEESLSTPTQNNSNLVKYREADYVNYACPRMNGEIEFILDDGSRVDCETDTHSIEFDFGKKWAEAIGQTLYYSSKTGKQPGIVLIIAKENDWNNLEKIKNVAKKYGFDIKLWSIRPEALTENK